MSIASTKRDILNSLKDREYRAAFNVENVYTTICFQLRALREQRVMSQAAFGQKIKPKMAQERISILEDPNADSKPTLNTLLRLAEGLDVGLEVRFVPFSIVLERSTHTNMRELEVESFEDELPRLEQAIAVEDAHYQPQPLASVGVPPIMQDAAMAAFYRPTQPVSPTRQIPNTSWDVLNTLVGSSSFPNTPQIATFENTERYWYPLNAKPVPASGGSVAEDVWRTKYVPCVRAPINTEDVLRGTPTTSTPLLINPSQEKRYYA